MNFGGPVWHASGCERDDLGSQTIALTALSGVGDARLGEWRERGNRGIVHVRRRLSDTERGVVGDARDIRGTPEAARRMVALLADLPPHVRAMLPERGRRRE